MVSKPVSYAAPRRPSGSRLARAYSQIGLETQVLSASPEHLITLLFNGAAAAILQARLHMDRGNIAARGLAISKAIDIVDTGLKTSVDTEKGGELATNLISVYDIVIQNLMLANLQNDKEKLGLAERLLTELGEAWKTSVDTARPHSP